MGAWPKPARSARAIPSGWRSSSGSKKLDNHTHALSIYFMHYNFVRIHQALRVTPAMQAAVSDRLWDLSDIVAVVDQWEVNQSTP
jgi:hypothetical protein